MRTTVDLPAELMQSARMRAAEHGESLKELFARAVAEEVGSAGPDTHSGRRLSLPLVGDATGPAVDVTNADIDAAFDSDAVEHYESSGTM